MAVEVPLENGKTSGSKNARKTKNADLREGVRGGLTVNNIDAGAPSPAAEDGENLATPGFAVPEGQTTHE
jgi:hypothetical protein